MAGVPAMSGSSCANRIPCLPSIGSTSSSFVGCKIITKSRRGVKAIQGREISMTAAVTPPASKEVETPLMKRKVRPAPVEPHQQVAHSLTPEKLEVVKSMEGWAQTRLLPLLKPVERSWQPVDFVPDPASEGFLDEVREMRKVAEGLPDDYLVCLVGDMITEEGLPTYQTMLNTLDGTRDETGASPSPWGIWTRAWTAEENRHGDLLNRYLYLTGRVNMRSVETTIQYLIGSGMDPKTENNPYLGFVYTSFQERATHVSHGNTAKHAKQFGDERLARICDEIAKDEMRHERAYTRIVEKLFELDPDGTMLAFKDMMTKGIVMPAHLMYDGENDTLFENFSLVAQRTGVYTGYDYADILQHLVRMWKIETMTGLSSEGAKAQEFLAKLPPRIRKLADRQVAMQKRMERRDGAFSWVFNRKVALL
eukprot:TRINITY_DN195_c0_g1_i1.p1 TRINITY_DN195_c0_g1~~TRINITY_DN195_c0_g1_i1.p1  ORF type:complete len:440 (-),score=83.74 TRINITY_DN195_c0_g1_i1:670-1938(-)